MRGDRKGAGKITYHRPDKVNEHDILGNHLTNEQFKKTWEPDKGEKEEWVKSGQNHLLDCAAMASAAGASVGVKPAEVEREAPPEQPADNWAQELLG